MAGATLPVHEVQAADLERPGVVFAVGRELYRTTGEALGRGGMGCVYFLDRVTASGEVDRVAGKVFHAEYLYQNRTDEHSRREHEGTMRRLERVAALRHPHLLPVLVSEPIVDNHLLVTPAKAETLLAAVARGALSPRARLDLLVQALRGLSALHGEGLLHRDVTLRNILIDDGGACAYLFDFDLTLALEEVAGVSYRQYYQGRVYGSPGYSVPPETLDPALLDTPIGTRLDVFAIGGALFGLFTDQTPYGAAGDMWGLLHRISEGIVFHGESRIDYPPSVPEVLRPVIERCLERDPAARYPGVDDVIAELEQRADHLVERHTRMFDVLTVRGENVGREERLRGVCDARLDPTVPEWMIERVDASLARLGYEIQRSLGRVKGHPIFVAAPSPVLLASGQFPDANTYPKIVTAIDLASAPDPAGLVERWLGRYLPVLRTVRQGLLTALYRVVHDEAAGSLLLFSEYVDDARFGGDLARHDLGLTEAFGLGFLCARQVGLLHEHGLAHTNVRAAALLLKGMRETRQVHPAMVGLVAPSLDPAAMLTDVRDLSGLILSWIRPARVDSCEPRVRVRIDDLRSRLAAAAFSEAATPGIDWLIHASAEGLCAIDRNFALLRQHGGDLDAYTLLLVSLPLYGRLWPS